MATYVLKWSDQGGNGSVAYPECAGQVVSNRYEVDLASAPLKGVTLAVNDIIDLGIIPAGTVPVDVVIDSDDLDSGTALAFDVGVITGTPGDAVSVRTCGSEFFSASNIAQAGGVARTSKKEAFRIAPAGVDRSIGLKITTAATGLPTSGKLGVSLRVIG